MAVELTSKSTTLPLSVAEAKRQLVIDSTDHDTHIADLIKAAQEYAERLVNGGRTVMGATYTLKLRAFPPGADPLELPYPPLIKVATAAGSITYYNGNNVSTTMSSTEVYTTARKNLPGTIEPIYNTTWPLTVDRPDSVTIKYVAGYAAAASVPETIKHMIRLIITDWYENRGDGQSLAGEGKVSDGTRQAVEALASSNGYGFYA